jgi:flagellin-like hook-associated protein FlgL
MLINTDLPADTTLASRQSQRTDSGTTASQTFATATNGAADSQLDPSLQRLADLPAGVQDSDWEIQDEHGATQALDSLRQGMLGQPGLALAAQANQLPQNVLSLLHPLD